MKAILLLSALLLTGCQAAPERVVLQQVKVPIPVECREPVPDLPAMPTESLMPGVKVDQFAKAAMAEIERREGYEVQLRAALDNCRKPINSER